MEELILNLFDFDIDDGLTLIPDEHGLSRSVVISLEFATFN
jgi:hypothetical protein